MRRRGFLSLFLISFLIKDIVLVVQSETPPSPQSSISSSTSSSFQQEEVEATSAAEDVVQHQGQEEVGDSDSIFAGGGTTDTEVVPTEAETEQSHPISLKTEDNDKKTSNSAETVLDDQHAGDSSVDLLQQEQQLNSLSQLSERTELSEKTEVSNEATRLDTSRAFDPPTVPALGVSIALRLTKIDGSEVLPQEVGKGVASAVRDSVASGVRVCRPSVRVSAVQIVRSHPSVGAASEDVVKRPGVGGGSGGMIGGIGGGVGGHGVGGVGGNKGAAGGSSGKGKAKDKNSLSMHLDRAGAAGVAGEGGDEVAAAGLEAAAAAASGNRMNAIATGNTAIGKNTTSSTAGRTTSPDNDKDISIEDPDETPGPAPTKDTDSTAQPPVSKAAQAPASKTIKKTKKSPKKSSKQNALGAKKNNPILKQNATSTSSPSESSIIDNQEKKKRFSRFIIERYFTGQNV